MNGNNFWVARKRSSLSCLKIMPHITVKNKCYYSKAY